MARSVPKYPTTTVAIEPSLRKEVADYMKQHKLNMTIVVNEALREWLDRR